MGWDCVYAHTSVLNSRGGPRGCSKPGPCFVRPRFAYPENRDDNLREVQEKKGEVWTVVQYAAAVTGLL